MFLELVWLFYYNIAINQGCLSSMVRGKSVTLTAALINQVLGTYEDGLNLEALVEEVDLLPL